MAHSPSFLVNQKARNAIVGAENLLKCNNALDLKLRRGCPEILVLQGVEFSPIRRRPSH